MSFRCDFSPSDEGCEGRCGSIRFDTILSAAANAESCNMFHDAPFRATLTLLDPVVSAEVSMPAKFVQAIPSPIRPRETLLDP